MKPFLGAWWLAALFTVNAWAADPQSMLWEFRKPGSPPSYLLGTIHSASGAVLAKLPALRTKVCGARRVYGELDLSDWQQLQNSRSLVSQAGLNQGPPWVDQLTVAEQRQLLTQLARQLLPEHTTDSTDREASQHPMLQELLNRLQPWMVAVMLQMPAGQEETAPLDVALEQMAKQCHVPVQGIETIDEQLAPFIGLTREDQMDLLRHSLREARLHPQLVADLTTAWLKGDLQALTRAQDAADIEENNPRLQALDKALLDDRNHRMFYRTMGNITLGNVFIAVGALHLGGANGLIAHLRQAGWSVRPLPVPP